VKCVAFLLNIDFLPAKLFKIMSVETHLNTSKALSLLVVEYFAALKYLSLSVQNFIANLKLTFTLL